MVSSTARSQAETRPGQKSPRLHMYLCFTWERSTAVSSHYVSVSELTAFPAMLRPDWLVETRGVSAAVGTLCFHEVKSLPALLAVLNAFLGQSRGAGRTAAPYVLLARGQKERGEQFLFKLPCFIQEVTPRLSAGPSCSFEELQKSSGALTGLERGQGHRITEC